MNGYEFHPEAEIDLIEIWEYIASDNPAAADRVIADFAKPSIPSRHCRSTATGGQTSPIARSASYACGII